jgi:hypothetical protein
MARITLSRETHSEVTTTVISEMRKPVVKPCWMLATSAW